MITYSWKNRANKEETGIAESVDELKQFIRDNKKEISYMAVDINDTYWEFDRKRGWKELDHDPQDVPF